MIRAAAGGEGVRRLARNEVHARHRHVGTGRQLAHDAEEIGRLLLGQWTRAVSGQDDPVREPVAAEVQDHGEHESEHEPLHAAEQLADPEEQAGEDTEEQGGLERVRHAATRPSTRKTGLYLTRPSGAPG